jgi:uncharacterized protein YkvS
MLINKGDNMKKYILTKSKFTKAFGSVPEFANSLHTSLEKDSGWSVARNVSIYDTEVHEVDISGKRTLSHTQYDIIIGLPLSPFPEDDYVTVASVSFMAKSEKVLIKTGQKQSPDADFIDLEMPNILKEFMALKKIIFENSCHTYCAF